MIKRPLIVVALAVASIFVAAAHGDILPSGMPASMQARATHQGVKVIYGEADYACCNSFAQLAQTSPVIVEVRVVAQSASYSSPATTSARYTAPQPTIDASQIPPGKATAIAALRALPTLTPGTIQSAPLILTDSTVEVVRTLKGPITPGQRLTVAQPGGTLQGWQLVDRESPLLMAGSTEVLFLMPPAPGGSIHDAYQISQGAQARFTVRTDGSVEPFSAAYAYLAGLRGRTVDDIVNAVRSAS